ncbi:MAG: lysylphosphatidylglycerol synthase domain-containing protein [Proteobacteria bacterium]|nr:lysylphosphatidylglycerol synthase domain-containing protein [Pseudomonadota bacterium]
MSNARRWLRFSVPVLVTVGALVFLFATIDFGEAVARVDSRVALLLLPTILIYGVGSLVLEALSLNRLFRGAARGLDVWTCARIKAASYPLSLLHYAIGAAGLSFLLRRRGGMALSEAAGAVLLIAFLDLGLLLVLTAVGAGLLATRAPVVRAGLAVGMAVGLTVGFAFLRTRLPVGPLEWVRELEIFRTVREASTAMLWQVGALRLLFVMLFMALGVAAMAAFGIPVPLGDLVVNMAAVALVAALPIAIAGLGTGQVAFVYLFRHWSDPETLLACSLTLSAALLVMRVGLGIAFAREYAREAMVAVREAEAEAEA